MSILNDLEKTIEDGDIQELKWKLFDTIFNMEFDRYKRNYRNKLLASYFFFYYTCILHDLIEHGMDSVELEKLKDEDIINIESKTIHYGGGKTEDEVFVNVNEKALEELREFIVNNFYNKVKNMYIYEK
jgi:hypothetical protein